MNIEKEKESQQNVSDKKKRERRNKFARLKDTLHKGFGTKKINGFGSGSCYFCTNCNSKPLSGVKLKDDGWYCGTCGKATIIFKERNV